jgi:hypothetical protein
MIFRDYSEAAYYSLLGLTAKKHWSDKLSVNVCRELSNTESACVLAESLGKGSMAELKKEAADFFGDKAIYYIDSDGFLQETYFTELD